MPLKGNCGKNNNNNNSNNNSNNNNHKLHYFVKLSTDKTLRCMKTAPFQWKKRPIKLFQPFNTSFLSLPPCLNVLSLSLSLFSLSLSISLSLSLSFLSFHFQFNQEELWTLEGVWKLNWKCNKLGGALNAFLFEGSPIQFFYSLSSLLRELGSLC